MIDAFGLFSDASTFEDVSLGFVMHCLLNLTVTQKVLTVVIIMSSCWMLAN